MTREELEISRKQFCSTMKSRFAASLRSAPLFGKWLRKKATNILAGEAILGDTNAVNLLAEALTNHTAPEVQAIAGGALNQLKNPEAIEAFCDCLMAYRDSNPDSRDGAVYPDAIGAHLLRIALDKGYVPKEEAKRALFYFITEQWEQYELLDFQEGNPLLCKGYAQASEEVKRRFLEVARQNGRSDILSETLVGRGKQLRIGEMSDAEWATIVEGLKSESRWDEMLRILFLAPVEWAAEMVLAMKSLITPKQSYGLDGGWKAKEEERYLWEEIMGLCPREGKRVVLPDPTGELIRTLKGHEHWVWCLALTPDGKMLAGGSYDRTVRLWSLPDGKLIRTLTGHREPIWCLSITPDGKTLASGSLDKTVRLWSLPDGELIRTLEGHTKGVWCLSITPDGKILASGSYDKTVRLWSLPDGEFIKTLEGHTNAIKCLALTPDGRLLASGGFDRTVRLWRLPDGEHIRTLTGHRESIWCLALTPDGRILASGSYDNTVRLWRLPDGEHIRTLEGHKDGVWCLALTPDGRILASGGYDNTVRLWSLPDGEHIRTLEGHSAPIWCLSITPDGRLLASGGKDNTVRLWRLPDGEHIRTPEGHRDFVVCLAITSDGKILASGSEDRTVRLWKLAWAKPLAFAGDDDLEYVQGILRERNLSESKRRGWQFLEALLKAKFRFEIT
ncbi:hypothetical protein H8E77_22440 [bacterium]|nr:hypothetical protein [bacterium]